MIQNSLTKNQSVLSSCKGHSDFEEVIKQIKKRGNYEECLQTADDLYGIKQYNILQLTPKKIAHLYESVCNRVYMKSSKDHQNSWVGYELKIFVWLIVCHLCHEISRPERIGKQLWQKYSRIFHNKNIQLIQYQAKLVSCSQSQPRKWQKHQQLLLNQIMKQIYTLLRSNQIHSKWNEVAKNLYLKSDKKYFRNPKQIRQHWLNHLDPQISKSQWNIQEDYLIVKTVLEHGRKWALVAKLGGGTRTQHMIKNRYHTLLRLQQKLHQSTHDKQKLLKLLLKRIQQERKVTKNQPKLEQLSQQSYQDHEECLSQQKNQFILQNKNELQNNEKVQKIIFQNIQDIAQLQFRNWQQKSTINKRQQQLQFIQLAHCDAYDEIFGNFNQMI